MEYVSIRQIAVKWGISARRIQVLCTQNRIFGAVKIDSTWIIPADAEKPIDMRIRTGKYIKRKAMDIPDRCISRDDKWER